MRVFEKQNGRTMYENTYKGYLIRLFSDLPPFQNQYMVFVKENPDSIPIYSNPQTAKSIPAGLREAKRFINLILREKKAK